MEKYFGKFTTLIWRKRNTVSRACMRIILFAVIMAAMTEGAGINTALAVPTLGPNPAVLPAYSTTVLDYTLMIDAVGIFHPFGVAVGNPGIIYVADRLNDRVVMRDASGTWSVLSNGVGTGLGQFTHVGVAGGPAGIAVDSSGNLYVADWGNHRVQKRDSGGNWTAWGAQPWGTSGSNLGEFNNPTGVAVDNAGNVYVADTTNNRIQKRDTSGVWTAWSDYNWVPGGFFGPKGVAVDVAGNIYVADQSNNKIQLRDTSGVWSIIATAGSTPGLFNNPTQAAVDSAGNVYVSDTYNYRGQRRDAAGAWTAWGSAGGNSDQFDTPEGMAVDPAGNVYVADTMNNRIQMFTQQNGNIYKQVNNDQALQFSLADFTNVFTPTSPGSYSLVSVRIDSLPVHGTLRLGSTAVTAAQVIPAASLGTLTYTPNSSYGGTDTIIWNAADQTGFAASPAAIGITVINVMTQTSTAVTASPSPSAYGASVTFTAAVSGEGGTPTGTVTFSDGSTVLSTRTLSNGSASFSTPALTVGAHSITASYSGDADFAGSNSSPRSHTVNRAVLSVTANSASRTYGAANPALTASYTGFVNGETSSVLTGAPSLSTTATTVSPAGTYAITAAAGTLAATNYTFSMINGILTVNRAPLTVTANNASRAYGAANPSFSASYAGFVNSDTSSVLTGAPSLTTTATTASPAGSYAITAAAGTLSAANYTFSFVNGALTVTTASQTITFAALAAGTYGNADFAPGATASSGLAISYTSSNTSVATIISGNIHIVSSGTATITANQSGNSNYTAASPVAQSLAVNRAILTVTGNNASKTYGAANPALTASYAGFLNNDTSSVLTGAPSLSTTATTASPAGSYTITAAAGTLSAVNYTFVFVNGSLTVNPATLTVTALDGSKTYGAANPAFTASYAGFVNNDTSSVLTGAPLLTTAATTASPVGAYAITAATGSLVAANYSFTFASGTLTVNRAILTVTANDAAKSYGAANPAFTASYGGFVNGDTSSALTGAPLLTTTATTASAPGAYVITSAAGTLGSANYSFSFMSGTLTVTQAGQTITFGILTPKTYGNADFSLSASATSGLPVTFTSSNTAVATVTGGTVHLVSAGTATITAAQAGDGNYTAAVSVSQPQTVNKVMITVTANNASRAYNTDNPALTASYTGFINNETQAVIFGNPSLSTTAIMTSPTGTYAITASLGSLWAVNYSFGFVNGTLTIGASNQNISFGTFQAARTYGEADFSLYATASSGLPVTYTSSNPSVATVTGSTVHIVSAGAATITAEQSGNANYDPAAPVAQPFTVNKATLTVTANNASRSYGEADPEFSAAYSGFVNNDTVAVLGGALVLSTTAGAASPAGAYDITPGGYTSTNYTIAYTNGVMTVNAILPAVSTAAFADATTISASSGGAVLSDGGSPVTARGVCWSLSLNPTIAETCSHDGTGTGSFASAMDGLNPGALYHVRAYATTAAGTGYGSDVAGNTLTAGDLSGDGIVDVTDALKSLRIAAGLDAASGPEIALGDVGPLVDGKPQPDGEIDLTDVVVILRMSVGYNLW